MKLLALGLLLCLVTLAACAAPDPTAPAKPSSTSPSTGSRAETLSRGEARTQEDKDIASLTQEDIIDPSPIATVSSIHVNVGDHVFVQVNIPNKRECTDLKVRDPYGNVAIALAPKEIRGIRDTRHGTGDFVQFRGEFFAPAAGDYLVDLGLDSENIRCGVSAQGRGGSSPRRAEVKWTVQPR